MPLRELRLCILAGFSTLWHNLPQTGIVCGRVFPLTKVDAGMDSSRGRSLTNLLLITIVVGVPVLALFRPPEGSVLSRILSAATGELELPPEEVDSGESLADLFVDDELPEAPPADGEVASADQFAETLSDKLEEFEIQTPPGSSLDGGIDSEEFSVSQPGVTDRLTYLREMGAVRTMWFSPGRDQSGFVAFFSSSEGHLSYRFEAVARTRAAAVQNVIDQVRDWQKE